jgi:hypothetical protein
MALTKTPIELSSTPGIVDNSNATAITIDSSENVGIGKAVPAYILDIEGASPRMWMKDTTASGSHFEIGVDTSAVGLGNRANLPLNLFTNNTTRMTIASSGSVGIGGSTITDVNLLNIQGSGASKNIGVVFNDTNTSKIFAIQNGGSALKFFDYTASAERARIDASGNLLVGKSTTAFGTVGIRLEGPNGKIEATRNNNIVMDLNRLSGDGAIANFSKDGTTVGSIGSHVNGLLIGTTEGSDAFLKFESNAVRPSAWNGSYRDASIDLGHTSSRFKDLYLSGGVYLGGTGAANKLDDYEEGTWTPDVGGAGVTWSYQQGVYTKVGRLVTVTFWLQAGSTDSSSGTVSIVGLPFATNSVGRNTVAVRAYNLNNVPSGTHGIVGWTSGTSTSVTINFVTGGMTGGTAINKNVWQQGAELHFSLTYMTA